MTGSSLGAGRVLVTEIDGYPVEVTGNYHTILARRRGREGLDRRHRDGALGVRAQRRDAQVTRRQRGGDAFMVWELDEQPDERVRDALRALPWVRWAFRLEKVGA
jgi:L-serine dehydratase